MLRIVMYKKTDCQQRLFGIDTQLSESLRNRLESSDFPLANVELIDWYIQMSIIHLRPLRFRGKRSLLTDPHPCPIVHQLGMIHERILPNI